MACSSPYKLRYRKGIALTEEANKLRAEIRARQAEDGKKAMAEYEANAAATRAKTEKLRALRLARDAAEAAAPQPVAKTKAKATKKKKAPAGKLSDWLDEQADSGRST
jgi:hypothetical protein